MIWKYTEGARRARGYLFGCFSGRGGVRVLPYLSFVCLCRAAKQALGSQTTIVLLTLTLTLPKRLDTNNVGQTMARFRVRVYKDEVTLPGLINRYSLKSLTALDLFRNLLANFHGHFKVSNDLLYYVQLLISLKIFL